MCKCWRGHQKKGKKEKKKKWKRVVHGAGRTNAKALKQKQRKKGTKTLTRGELNNSSFTKWNSTIRQVRSQDIFILSVTRNDLSSFLIPNSFQLTLMSMTSYPGVGGGATTAANDSVIPVRTPTTIIYFLNICVNTIMHRVLESVIKRFYVIQVKSMILIFHVLKLLNL